MTPNKLIDTMISHPFARVYAFAGLGSSLGVVLIAIVSADVNYAHLLLLLLLHPLLTGVIMSIVVGIADSLVIHDEPYPGVVFNDNSTVRELIRLTLCAWWFPITFYARYRWG